MIRLLLSLLLFSFSVEATTDLNQKPSPFVLHVQEIKIPDFPYAFNPSLIRFKGRLLLAFRTRDPADHAHTDGMGLVWLNENFQPEGKAQLLDIRLKQPILDSYAQEPKLVAIGEGLYIVFSNRVNGMSSTQRRVYVAELHHDGKVFFISEAEPLLHFLENSNRQEKNWVPFEYEGHLLLSYSLVPHRILRPLLNRSKKCEEFAESVGAVRWNWGKLRGGTPAALEGNSYLAFFHSSKDLTTVQSKGKHVNHYFMGAYTFASTPPFEITAVSPEPIVHKSFYAWPDYPTWKPLLVVYPGGYVSDEKFIWVAYGRQDHEIWIAKLDKKGLMKSLVPVSTIR